MTRTCVECDGRTLSYAELIALIDARAQALAPLVRDGDVVAIRREKSERYVVDLLAVLALGAVAMPIDPRLPEARVETSMNAVPPQAVITDDGLRATGRPSAIAGHPKPRRAARLCHVHFGQHRQAHYPRECGFSDLGFAAKFDKMSYVREHNGATSLLVQYRNNLFERADIETFTSAWIDALDAVVSTERTERADAEATI